MYGASERPEMPEGMRERLLSKQLKKSDMANNQYLFNILHDLGVIATADDMQAVINAVDLDRGATLEPDTREIAVNHWPIYLKACTERQRQNRKFGQNRNLNPFIWLAILGEEVGEVNKAVLEWNYDGRDLQDYKKELIEVIAVSLAAIEDLDNHGEPKR